jgi:polyisoprenoid-binding protein YceI
MARALMRIAIPSLLVTAVAAALAAAALPAGPNSTAQAIKPQESTLVASFKQQAVVVDAPFTRFDGSIHYDPAHADTTRATLHVDTSSLDIGDEDSDAEVRGASWLDSAHFPTATFESTRVTARDTQHFDATGNLTIKGHTRPVTVTVTVTTAAHGYVYDGSFELSRRDFGIGDPQWDSVLDDRVRVRFHLL